MFKTKREFSLGVLVALAAFIAVGDTQTASAQSSCARYVSSGETDDPFSGELVGSSLVTLTIGFSAGIEGSYSVTFHVGVYEQADGERRQVRCDNYTEFEAPN